MTFEEKTLSSQKIYSGKVINLKIDDVTSKSGVSKREIVEHGGGSVIAAVTEDNNMVLVLQFRKPVGRVMLEAPAGKREKGEQPIDTAIRELKEETGYTAKTMRHLTKIYTTPGYSEEVLDLFLASELEAGETDFDDNESIEVVEYPISELKDKVMKGEIEDSKTQVAILMASEIIGLGDKDYEV